MRKKIAVFVLVVLMAVPAFCFAADAGVINHVVAAKFQNVPGKGILVDGPLLGVFVIPPGTTAPGFKISSLDQLVLKPGNYRVDLKIIEDATGRQTDIATHNNVSIKREQPIVTLQSQLGLTTKAGLYTYQVVVNNEVIATFKISVVDGQ